jgi:hypothetical protein
MSIYRKPDIERMRRCITSAMGCLDPLSRNLDEQLAWHRLLDAIEGREPRPTRRPEDAPSPIGSERP